MFQENKERNICLSRIKALPLQPQTRKQHRGVEQLVARQAHNLEVTCSSHVSATFTLGSPLYKGFPSFRNGKVGRISDDVSGHIGCMSKQCKKNVHFKKVVSLREMFS